MTAFQPVPARFLPRDRRFRFADLDQPLQQIILTYCCTAEDLSQLGLQLEVPVACDPADILTRISQRLPLEGLSANRLHKRLDIKFHREVADCSCLSNTDQLLRHWKQQHPENMPALFWALVTHPLATDNLRQQLQNQLQFQAAQTLKQSTPETTQQSDEIRSLRARLSKLRDQSYQKIIRLETSIRQFEHQISHHLSTRPRMSERVLKSSAQQEQQLLARTQLLEDQLEQQRARNTELAARAENMALQIKQLEDKNLALSLSAQIPDETTQQLNNLSGKRVLYLGEEGPLRQALQTLVERQKGRLTSLPPLIDSCALQAPLSRADMVFCPHDCTAQASCKQAALHCQRHAKPFIPVPAQTQTAEALTLRLQ